MTNAKCTISQCIQPFSNAYCVAINTHSDPMWEERFRLWSTPRMHRVLNLIITGKSSSIQGIFLVVQTCANPTGLCSDCMEGCSEVHISATRLLSTAASAECGRALQCSKRTPLNSSPLHLSRCLNVLLQVSDVLTPSDRKKKTDHSSLLNKGAIRKWCRHL